MSMMTMVSVVIHVVNCRKAKAKLQDGFQLSYQPTPLNQLQDGGDNLIIIVIIIIIIIIINIIIITTIIIYIDHHHHDAGSVFKHVSATSGDAEDYAKDQGQ